MIFAGLVSPAVAGWGKPGDDRLRANHNTNEIWGKWELGTDSEGPHFFCQGYAAYGRSFDNSDWTFAFVNRDVCCGHPGYGSCSPFSKDPSRGNHDKQCWCQTLNCVHGTPNMQNGKLACPDYMPKPSEVQVCLVGLWSQEAGTGLSSDKTLETFTGHQTSSSLIESKTSDIVASVQTSVSATDLFASMSIDASLKSEFTSSMQSSYAESSQSWTKTTWHQVIDPTKPTYIYSTQIVITTDVGHLTIAGRGTVVMTHPAKTICANAPAINLSGDVAV